MNKFKYFPSLIWMQRDQLINIRQSVVSDLGNNSHGGVITTCHIIRHAWTYRWQSVQALTSKQLTQYPWTSYQIRKIAGCACARNAGNVFPRRRFQSKPLVSDPGMHHGTCVTHVPWCMSGSLTCGDGENVPGIPGACAPAILRIWQEAHGVMRCNYDIIPGSPEITHQGPRFLTKIN